MRRRIAKFALAFHETLQKMTTLEGALERTAKEKETLAQECEERYKAKFKEGEEVLRHTLELSYGEREKQRLEAREEEMQKAFNCEKLR